MSLLSLFAAAAVGVGVAGVAGLCRPPTRRLSPRVHPYVVVARSALGHPPEPVASREPQRVIDATLPRLFGPALRAGW
jgi:hypothetical protein